MDEFRKDDRLQKAFDATLSGLNGDPWLAQRVLTNTKGEEKVKKKLSAGFVLVLVLVLVAAVALAVVTITEPGRLIAQTEKENGDYLEWPIEKRIQVVRELIEEGYIPETTERKQLRDGTLSQEDAAHVADNAIAEFTGEDAKYASFLSIMNAAWGPFENWTNEQKAWYSQLMTAVGFETSGKTNYVMPTDEMTAEEAVTIAKSEIARGFDMTEELINKYRVYDVSFQIPEFAEPGDTKAYWYVALDTWGTELDGQEGLPIYAIDVFVDPDTGLLLEPIEEIVAARKAAIARNQHPLSIAIQEFYATSGVEKTFEHWSLENKARWADEIAPLIRDYLVEHPNDSENLLARDALASVDFHYGLPSAQAISQEQALAIARESLQSAYQLSDEELSLLFDTGIPYYTCLFYDVTDESQPLWKLLLYMPSIYDSDEAIANRVLALYGKRDDYDRIYKVELNAYTGDVVRVMKMQYHPDNLDEYKNIL